MASFSNQFHATLDELIDFVKDVLRQQCVYATALHHPFRTEPVSGDNIRDVLSLSSVSKIVFTESPPILLSATTGTQLLDKNEGSLELHIGRLRDGSLEQSWLSTTNASPTWKKINALLKSRTTAGMLSARASEKARKPVLYRDFRFTIGAKTLSEQGTALRVFAQSPTVLHPDDKVTSSE
jgi:hypothetical protein